MCDDRLECNNKARAYENGAEVAERETAAFGISQAVRFHVIGTHPEYVSDWSTDPVVQAFLIGESDALLDIAQACAANDAALLSATVTA